LGTLQGLSDWVKIKDALSNLDPVEHIEVQAIGSGRVQFQMSYSGEMNRLLRAMHTIGYNLRPEGNFYILVKQ